MKGKIVLRVKEIKKRFLQPISFDLLQGISLEVERGSTIAIMGKSGEGKSTLLHILGTLENPTSGTVEICGCDVSSACVDEIRNQHIGFIFQSSNLLDEYTALDNVLMPARIARKNVRRGSSLYTHALDLLQSVGLAMRAHFPAKVLSGGEKQRTAIARALCNAPDLILADEPSGDLDHAQSEEIHQLLIQLTKKQQKTLIVVTHDRELAALCDRTYLLKEGYLNPIQDFLCTF